jgi:hypothetical protein
MARRRRSGRDWLEEHGLDEDDLLDELEPDRPKEPARKGPGRILLAFLLGLLLILMVVPFYSIKADPEPKGIPSLAEAIAGLELSGNHTPIAYQDFPIAVKLASRDPALKAVADRIATRSCASGETVCHAKALFYFVRDELDYVQDPASYEYIKTAQEALVNSGGDCDDASLLLASLLAAVGVEARFVFVPRHVYVEAYLPDALSRYTDEHGWVSLDPTCVGCGFGEVSLATLGARKSYVG